MRVAVLASGHGSNLQSLLDAFPGPPSPAVIALVISNKASAGALARAADRGVPTATVVESGDDAPRLLELLTAHAAELVVLAGYLKKVPDAVVRAYRGRMLNVHPALLPCFGGAGMYGRRVHEAVLASGARVTGVTVHLVDEQYDHGPIVAQWPVPVRPGDTAEYARRARARGGAPAPAGGRRGVRAARRRARLLGGRRSVRSRRRPSPFVRTCAGCRLAPPPPRCWRSRRPRAPSDSTRWSCDWPT